MPPIPDQMAPAGNVLRKATEEDLPHLAAIYREGVQDIGRQQYSAIQVDAWAAFAKQTKRFRDFVMNAYTLVLERESSPIAFAGLEPDGHIASLYVDAGKQRSGAGTILLKELEHHARESGIPLLYSEASEFSKPLFLRNGYTVDREETVEYGDVSFLRYVVVKALEDCG